MSHCYVVMRQKYPQGPLNRWHPVQMNAEDSRSALLPPYNRWSRGKYWVLGQSRIPQAGRGFRHSVRGPKRPSVLAGGGAYRDYVFAPLQSWRGDRKTVWQNDGTVVDITCGRGREMCELNTAPSLGTASIGLASVAGTRLAEFLNNHTHRWAQL